MSLTQRQRLRRAGLLCCYCLRNLALYRARHNHPQPVKGGQFWVSANGAFLDATVLEWCKLFADSKSKYHYAKVIHVPAQFKADLLANLGVMPAQFDAFVTEVRTLRDKFIAHLDDLPDMQIPTFDIAKGSAIFLYERLLAQAADTDTFHDAPASASDFYDETLAIGRAAYAA